MMSTPLFIPEQFGSAERGERQRISVIHKPNDLPVKKKKEKKRQIMLSPFAC